MLGINFERTTIFAAALAIPMIAIAEPPVPVVVKNTSANPVPVTGTINVTAPAPLPVSGSVSVSASAPLPVVVNGGSVSVSAASPLPVTGTFTATLPSSVSVANSPATPLYTTSVSSADRAPAQIRLAGAAFVGHGLEGEALSTMYLVPAGKRLVVHQVNGSVSWGVPSSPAGVRIWFNTAPNPGYFGSGPDGVNGIPVGLYSPGFVMTVDSNGNEWASAQGEAYFDGGTTIWVGAVTSSSSFATGVSTPAMEIMLTGYMIDCAQSACPAIVTQ